MTGRHVANEELWKRIARTTHALKGLGTNRCTARIKEVHVLVSARIGCRDWTSCTGINNLISRISTVVMNSYKL